MKVIVGTNDQGWHGATLAKFAKENWNIKTHEFRGVLSDGVYGIPTRYHPVDTEPPFLKTRSLNAIKDDVEEFIKHAKESAKTSKIKAVRSITFTIFPNECSRLRCCVGVNSSSQIIVSNSTNF